MRKVGLLPTRDCKAGYGPGFNSHNFVGRKLFTYLQANRPWVRLEQTNVFKT